MYTARFIWITGSQGYDYVVITQHPDGTKTETVSPLYSRVSIILNILSSIDPKDIYSFTEDDDEVMIYYREWEEN